MQIRFSYNGFTLNRIVVFSVVLAPLIGTAQARAERGSNQATLFLSSAETRREMQRSHVAPLTSEDVEVKRQPFRFDPDPTADAESRVEINALYEAAEAFRQQGSADKAVPFYEKAASKGHSLSLVRLGEIYSVNSAGIEPDPAKATEYYELAARAGERWALYQLGIMFRDGLGRDPDADKAASYFHQCLADDARADVGVAIASAASLLDAGRALGRKDLLRVLKWVRENNAGRPADRCVVMLAAAALPPDAENQNPETAPPEAEKLRTEAVMELERAINSGASLADEDLPRMQYQLATLLQSSGVTEQDSGDRATGLLQSAADAGYMPARFRINRPTAQTVALELSSVDQAYAEKPGTAFFGGSRALIEAAADAGDAEAQAEMGKLSLHGLGCEKSSAKAFEWFRRAARGGSAEGDYQLGLCYSKGAGTKVNAYNAAAAFNRAALKGHAAAMYELGNALGSGRGVEKDPATSADWLNKASAAGSGAAAFALGKIALRPNQSGTRDVARATRHFLQGARAGDRRAQLEFLKIVFADSRNSAQKPPQDFGGATDQEVFVWSKDLAGDKTLAESPSKLATYYLGRCYADGIGTAKNLDQAALLFVYLTGVDAVGGPRPSAITD